MAVAKLRVRLSCCSLAAVYSDAQSDGEFVTFLTYPPKVGEKTKLKEIYV